MKCEVRDMEKTMDKIVALAKARGLYIRVPTFMVDLRIPGITEISVWN